MVDFGSSSTSKNKIKIRRKKVGDGVKKFVVRRKNSEYVGGGFLTSTTTTQSPFLLHGAGDDDDDYDEHALNRTLDDSRCKN